LVFTDARHMTFKRKIGIKEHTLVTDDEDSTEQPSSALSIQVKSSHIYLYSTFHNTDCIKAASQ